MFHALLCLCSFYSLKLQTAMQFGALFPLYKAALLPAGWQLCSSSVRAVPEHQALIFEIVSALFKLWVAACLRQAWPVIMLSD